MMMTVVILKHVTMMDAISATSGAATCPDNVLCPTQAIDAGGFLDYVVHLEKRLAARSDELEEIHLEAAIDAQLIDTPSSGSSVALSGPEASTTAPLFRDYTNPNAVSNCLSPYVPTQADRIAGFLRFAGLRGGDVLLDVGCGDGRVCVAAAKLTGCRSIGVDLSPPCIQLARQLAAEEGCDGCEFVLADATLDPWTLLAGTSRSFLSRACVPCCFSSFGTYWLRPQKALRSASFVKQRVSFCTAIRHC
jgi:SAM-dependent methyltransferase